MPSMLFLNGFYHRTKRKWLSHDMRHVGIPVFFTTRSILEHHIIFEYSRSIKKNKDLAMIDITQKACFMTQTCLF